jgi:hypothetical protein
MTKVAFRQDIYDRTTNSSLLLNFHDRLFISTTILYITAKNRGFYSVVCFQNYLTLHHFEELILSQEFPIHQNYSNYFDGFATSAS